MIFYIWNVIIHFIVNLANITYFIKYIFFSTRTADDVVLIPLIIFIVLCIFYIIQYIILKIYEYNSNVQIISK